MLISIGVGWRSKGTVTQVAKGLSVRMDLCCC